MLQLPDFSADLFGLVVGADGTIVHRRVPGKGPGKVCLCHPDTLWQYLQTEYTSIAVSRYR